MWFHFRWAREFWRIHNEQGLDFVNGIPVTGRAETLPASCLPDDLEFWLNRLTADPADRGYHLRPEYDHLKDISIDLGQIRLTDNRLMAVCMVFYGGVKKKRAAQAMNITSQALSDHIKAALKKIEDNIARH